MSDKSTSPVKTSEVFERLPKSEGERIGVEPPPPAPPVSDRPRRSKPEGLPMPARPPE